MTKVTLHFALGRPLDQQLLNRISSLHGVYGMARIIPEPGLRSLLVDYDASRLSAADVEAVLRRSGIPILAE